MTGENTYVEYARFADDLVILIDAYKRHDWLMAAVEKRLREELAELQVEINEEKSWIVDLSRGESFGFLGFDFRQVRSLRGAGRCSLHAQAQEADGAVAEAQGYVRSQRIETGWPGREVDQPGATRLGKLLCGRTFQRVL